MFVLQNVASVSIYFDTKTVAVCDPQMQVIGEKDFPKNPMVTIISRKIFRRFVV